jgi:bifunctional non-homologous end joining protein LigD
MTLSKADSFETPDLAVFDLDPTPNAEYDDVVEVANLLKEELDSMGLTSYVKTSGKKGLHILLPTVQEYTFKQTRSFVQAVGERIKRQNSLARALSTPKEPVQAIIWSNTQNTSKPWK